MGKRSRTLLAVALLPAIALAFAEGCATRRGVYSCASRATLIGRFRELDHNLNNGEGYSRSTNESGNLAWAESYLLEAYLEMYRATGDRAWIEKFLSHATRVIASTDKARGIKDYRGRSLFGWSSQKYSLPRASGNGEDSLVGKRPRVLLWVDTGMISYPFIKFALLVKEDAGLLSYTAEAQELARAAEEAVAVFDDRWRYDRKTGEGHLVFDDEPVHGNYAICKGECREAVNADLALGRVYLGLWHFTGRGQYLLRGRALATKLKNNLILEGTKYLWHYRYREDIPINQQIEDLSHGAIDVGFASDACAAGVIFAQEDLLRFAETLKLSWRGGSFSRFVDGTGDDPEKWFSDACGRWLDVARADSEVYRIVCGYLVGRAGTAQTVHPQVLVGMAKLLRLKSEDVIGHR